MIHPYEHQKRIQKENPRRKLLVWDTGTGKTYGSLFLAEQNANTILIVCPKGIRNKWERDIETIRVEGHLQSKTTKVITKEQFRKLWDSLDKYDCIIVDEAHYFSGMKSQMSKALLAYNKKWDMQYIYLLTATPFLSTAWNIYRLAQMMGIKWNYVEFYNTFFHKVRLGKYTNAPVVTKPRPNTEKKLADYVRKIADIVHMSDCVDIPEQVIEKEFFLTNSQQKSLKKKVSEIETNPAVKYTKYHQIENGTLKGNEYADDEIVNADKHDYIMELINNNERIAIFCRYNLQILSLESIIAKRFKDREVFVISGQNKEANDEVARRAEEADNCIVLINAHCSEGYELPSIGVILFASLSFSYKDYKQSMGRFLRINKLKKNVFTHLINEESVDEAVHSAIMNKQDFDMEIYAQNPTWA